MNDVSSADIVTTSKPASSRSSNPIVTLFKRELAAYFATQGFKPALMDLDAQGSSSRWLRTCSIASRLAASRRPSSTT
jgi:hypothetical protein